MTEKPTFPTIAPISGEILSSDTKRPFWSVMIPTYNCANYLEQTLKSVLEQDPGADWMQIEVVDDCSTKDDPEAVVRALGQGRVNFYCQPQNSGAIHNFNTCIQRSVGRVVHILHGDDFIQPGFYTVMEKAFQQEPEIGAAFCRQLYVTETNQQRFLSPLEQEEAGILSQILERIGVWCMIQTPSIVVKREVYEAIGGFHPDLFHAGDWEMWKRVAAHYPIWYEPQPLASYRTHVASHTSSLVRSGANIANTRRAIEISQSYLPDAVNHSLTHQARDFYAMYAFESACWHLFRRDVEAAMAQLSESLQCSHSPKVIGQMISFILQVSMRRGQKAFSALGRRLQPG